MSLTEILRVKKLSDTAQIPQRGSPDAAGFDLYSAKETIIPAGGKGIVKTDIAIATPINTYGRIAPRSGLAWKKHIDVGAGVIDADYRGNVGVVLFNHGSEDLHVAIGDRIAQLVLERISMCDITEVDELPETVRGAGGFGSTGVSKHEEEKLYQGEKSIGQKRQRIEPENMDEDVKVNDRVEILTFLRQDQIWSSLNLNKENETKLVQFALQGNLELRTLVQYFQQGNENVEFLKTGIDALL